MESVDRLSVLVDDVLDLTLLEADEGRIERTDVDLAIVAREAAETLRPAADRRKLDFAVEVARSTGRLSGDTRRIREMIEHLLRHAIASTPEKGRVLLHTDGNATRARIVVSDDGAG